MDILFFNMMYLSIKKQDDLSIFAYKNELNIENIIVPEIVGNLKVVEIEPLGLSFIKNGKSIQVGKNVRVIGNMAFISSKTIEIIDLGQGVEVLGSSLFKDCDSLKTIIIGPNVKEINNFCFHNNLEGDQIKVSIFVDDKNQFYYHKNGNIYSRKDDKPIYELNQ